MMMFTMEWLCECFVCVNILHLFIPTIGILQKVYFNVSFQIFIPICDV